MPTGQRPPIPPLHAKVELEGTIDTHVYRLISYLAVAGSGIGNNDLNTIATGITTAWNANVKAQMVNLNVLTGCKLTYIPAVGEEIQGNSAVSITGSLGTPLTDAAACIVVNWNVNRYFKGGHPRWYVPGLSTGVLTNSSDLGGTFRANVATAFNAYLNAVNALTSSNITSVTLGTLSFQHAKAWRNPPVFWQFFTATAGSKMGTQRRRLHT